MVLMGDKKELMRVGSLSKGCLNKGLRHTMRSNNHGLGKPCQTSSCCSSGWVLSVNLFAHEFGIMHDASDALISSSSAGRPSEEDSTRQPCHSLTQRWSILTVLSHIIASLKHARSRTVASFQALCMPKT